MNYINTMVFQDQSELLNKEKSFIKNRTQKSYLLLLMERLISYLLKSKPADFYSLTILVIPKIKAQLQ